MQSVVCVQGGPNPAPVSMAMCFYCERRSKAGRVLLHSDSLPVHGAGAARSWADKEGRSMRGATETNPDIGLLELLWSRSGA